MVHINKNNKQVTALRAVRVSAVCNVLKILENPILGCELRTVWCENM